MAEEPNIMTHDNFAGKMPTVNLRFPVIWTNTGPKDDNVRENGMSVISTPNVRDWESFKRDLFAPFEHSIDDVVTYIDSDDDQIPIESQCEFDEALRIATARATQKPRPISLYLVVDRGFASKTLNKKKNIYTQNLTPLAMPPIDLNDGGHECPHIQRPNDTNHNVEEPELSDDGVPKWFTSYIQKIKEEIVAEVSARVTKAVTEALNKKRGNRYDSGASNSPESDSKDSESDEANGNVREMDLLDDIKTGDPSLHSSHHRFRHPRRRNRHRKSEKQHKELNKNNNMSQAPEISETTSTRCYKSSSASRRRNEKLAKMRDDEDFLGSQSISDNSEQQNTSRKAPRESENLDGDFDTPYRRMIASGIRQMSFTPLDSTDLPEVPILKLRLPNSGSNEETKQNLPEEKSRMSCSVTGNDIFERSNDRLPDYCTFSDSDNISIISDVSHNSDMQRISNSFEIIVEQSMNIRDGSDVERELMITMDHEENDGEKKTNEDPEVRRDSSSFELLSEPPPPPLSIHMDEDHFSPDKNETKNYNVNDPTTSGKREIQDKMKSSTLVIDAQGRIHENNSDKICNEDSAKLIFPKRTDGSYSFVADTLPGLTKESVIGTGRSDLLADEEPVVIEDSRNEKESEIPEEKDDASNRDDKTFGDHSHRVFHESTQSFYSHTAKQSENNRQDFDVNLSTNGPEVIFSSTATSHIFVDHNASKGLGDTKQSSPKKQESRNKTHEDFKSERPKTSKRHSNSSNHGNSFRIKGNSPQNERSRRFDNRSTTRSRRVGDSDFPFGNVPTMHILPESLLFGAVNVASSAYTTARRVCDKILTTQTRKTAGKSRFGRR